MANTDGFYTRLQNTFKDTLIFTFSFTVTLTAALYMYIYTLNLLEYICTYRVQA